MKNLLFLGAFPNDGTGDSLHVGGSKINGMFTDMYNGRANVKDFGAVGDNATDDTVAIQAAIDYAYANKIVHVYLPAGRYNTSAPIWLNPIGNGRDPLSPFGSDSNWTLWLVGDGWGGSEFPGSYIQYSGSLTALFIGPGQNVGVRDLAIIGTGGTRISFPTSKVGVSILSAAGGAHITTLDGVLVSNFYYGFAAGLNNSILCDSNTLLRCTADNCYYGFYAAATQNFINSLLYCNFQNCKWSVISHANLPVEILGGNYSTFNAPVVAYPIISVQSNWATITSFTDTDPEQNGFPNAAFTVTISDPNNFIPSCDVYAIESAKLGVIPFKFQAWNPGTGILTLRMHKGWCIDRQGYGATGLGAITNLPVELSVKAAAYLYTCEQCTVLGSLGIHCRGIHVENESITRVAFATPGWAVSTLLVMKDVYLNFDSSAQSGAGSAPSSAAYALYVLAQVWPVIEVQAGAEISIDNTNCAGLWRIDGSWVGMHHTIKNIPIGSTEIPYINIIGTTPHGATNIWDNDQTGTSNGTSFSPFAEAPFRSAGDCDRNILPSQWDQQAPRINSLSRAPTTGYYPSPWTVPRLTPVQLDVLLGTLPAVRFDAGAMLYDAVCGDCIYQISHLSELDPRNLFVKFHHVGWSWGQQLPYNWTYVGGTFIVRFTRFLGTIPPGTGDVNNAFGFGKFLFPGLVFGIDYSENHIDDIAGIEWFTITAIHDEQGYIEVLPVRNFISTSFVEGHSGVTYTGTHITQQAFAVTKIGHQSANALTDTTVAGKYYSVGDLIWQKTPVGAGSMGWMCTTAGLAGTTAVFKTMPVLGP